MGLGVMGMVAMVPGFRRRFGNAAADQESCGDQGESRTRPGLSSRHHIIGIPH
jgi:hypothetical protein